jgi:hypothetical protein
MRIFYSPGIALKKKFVQDILGALHQKQLQIHDVSRLLSKTFIFWLNEQFS